MKQFTISEIFTDEEIEKARAIHADCAAGEFAKRFSAEVVAPAMERINRKTGQENDAKFLAYMMEYALGAAPAPRM